MFKIIETHMVIQDKLVQKVLNIFGKILKNGHFFNKTTQFSAILDNHGTLISKYFQVEDFKVAIKMETTNGG